MHLDDLHSPSIHRHDEPHRRRRGRAWPVQAFTPGFADGVGDPGTRSRRSVLGLRRLEHELAGHLRPVVALARRYQDAGAAYHPPGSEPPDGTPRTDERAVRHGCARNP
jgi:hypothetical protein